MQLKMYIIVDIPDDDFKELSTSVIDAVKDVILSQDETIEIIDMEIK